MLEIFFHDLDEEAQQRVLELYGINSPEDMNFDVVPLFVLEYEDTRTRNRESSNPTQKGGENHA